MKRNVIVIKEDVEIAKGISLSKGDTLFEMGPGRWTLIENDDEDEDDKKDKEDMKEEDKDMEDKKDDKEDDKKEESTRRLKLRK